MKRRVSKISKKSQVLCDIDGQANDSVNHSDMDRVNKINKDALSRINYNSHPDIPLAVALLTYLSYAIIIAVSS